MVTCLKDCLEEDLSNSRIEYCSWGPEDENGEPKKGSQNLMELSEEELTEARWETGETLGRSWEKEELTEARWEAGETLGRSWEHRETKVEIIGESKEVRERKNRLVMH